MNNNINDELVFQINNIALSTDTTTRISNDLKQKLLAAFYAEAMYDKDITPLSFATEHTEAIKTMIQDEEGETK